MEKIRVRFAPSPTGFIHVGNARTALFNWLYARQKGGVFILRVEDTDVERSRTEYERSLIKDLRWLGIDWDEGPDAGGGFGPYRQSERLEIYGAYTRQLLESGRAYYCFCSAEELEESRRKALAVGAMPIYGGRCRSISLEDARRRMADGEQAVVRLRIPDEGEIGFDDLVRGTVTFDLKLIGDSVLVRSNGLPAYNYAVVIDDHLMRITHVIRGEDHISNTPRQILTYRALSLEPPRFAHLAMVMGRDNTRLSKRHGATAVDQFEKSGILPEALFNYLALLGWAPPDGREILSRQELIDLFDLGKVGRSAAIFDYDKLNWLNRQHIKRLAPRKKAGLALPFLQEAGYLPGEMDEAHWAWLEKTIELLIERVDRFADLPSLFGLLFDFSPEAMDEEAKKEMASNAAKTVIRSFSAKIRPVKDFNYPEFARITNEIKKETGLKGKNLYHPLRLALTARPSGLDLDKFISIVEEGAKLGLPKDMRSCAERIAEVVAYLDNPAGKN
jgi:nondiscriminating glutamyl-tRNA synthetase